MVQIAIFRHIIIIIIIPYFGADYFILWHVRNLLDGQKISFVEKGIFCVSHCIITAVCFFQ